jgi:hypothetical protein
VVARTTVCRAVLLVHSIVPMRRKSDGSVNVRMWGETQVRAFASWVRFAAFLPVRM